MDMPDDGVRLRLERIRHVEPPTEKPFHKALLGDITQGHPHLLPPPFVAIRLKMRHVFARSLASSILPSVDLHERR
jgi:hypothetical protein